MGDILITQKDGFVDYEVPERLRYQDKEEWDDYRKRLGLEDEGPQDQVSCQEYGRRDAVTDYTLGAASIYRVSTAKEDEPRYLVEVNGVGVGGGDYEVVWVKTRADLLALRIQLAQLLQVEGIYVSHER